MEISPEHLKNMNQQCKVCGEPAAGFHFGAFTCEGCKSFFGRSYNNLASITECKNNGECVINKKNRTSCKACRLRKCLLVGMSKSGSRYGRRSNWFKIHCLLQEQKNKSDDGRLVPNLNRSKDELLLLGLDEYKTASSPSVSSPGSDSSSTHEDAKYLNNNTIANPYHQHHHHAPHLLHPHRQSREPTPAFFYPQHHHLVPPSMLLPPIYHPAFIPSLYPTPTPPPTWSDLPMDLSVKSVDSVETASVKSEDSSTSSIHVDDLQEERIHKDILSRAPLDLTTKVA